jgi:PncC family amidohydrolase
MADESLQSLAERLQVVCLAAGLTVATAESCTGGLVSSAITDVSGSSAYFLGGVVSYSNEAKAALLGVPAELLTMHGAVSAQVARAMADGARERLGVDMAAAVTGVAGPGGGTPAKPVGLTYVAVADREGVAVQRYTWPGNRLSNKDSSARAALTLLLERAQSLASGGSTSGGRTAQGRTAGGSHGPAAARGMEP